MRAERKLMDLGATEEKVMQALCFHRAEGLPLQFSPLAAFIQDQLRIVSFVRNGQLDLCLRNQAALSLPLPFACAIFQRNFDRFCYPRLIASAEHFIVGTCQSVSHQKPTPTGLSIYWLELKHARFAVAISADKTGWLALEQSYAQNFLSAPGRAEGILLDGYYFYSFASSWGVPAFEISLLREKLRIGFFADEFRSDPLMYLLLLLNGNHRRYLTLHFPKLVLPESRVCYAVPESNRHGGTLLVRIAGGNNVRVSRTSWHQAGYSTRHAVDLSQLEVIEGPADFDF